MVGILTESPDSVDSDGPLHSIEVLKVEIHSLTRKILIPLTTFLNTSLRMNWIDQQIIRRDLKGCKNIFVDELLLSKKHVLLPKAFAKNSKANWITNIMTFVRLNYQLNPLLLFSNFIFKKKLTCTFTFNLSDNSIA